MRDLRKDKAGGERFQLLYDGYMMLVRAKRQSFADLLLVDVRKIKEGAEVGRVIILPKETFLCQRLVFKPRPDKDVADTRPHIGDDKIIVFGFFAPASYQLVLLVPFLGGDAQLYRDPYFLAVDIKFEIKGESVRLTGFSLSYNSDCRHFLNAYKAYFLKDMPTQAGY